MKNAKFVKLLIMFSLLLGVISLGFPVIAVGATAASIPNPASPVVYGYEKPDGPDSEPELPSVYTGTRPSFTADNPPTYAVFNSIVDHPEFGNEFDFVSITDLGTQQCYRGIDVVTLKANQEYLVEIFFHNDAAWASYDSALCAQAAVDMPYRLSANATKPLYATLSSSSTTPEAISSSVALTANQSLIIEYVADSAFRNHDGRDTVIDYTELFGDGVDLTLRKWVAADDSGTIRFKIRPTLDENEIATPSPNPTDTDQPKSTSTSTVTGPDADDSSASLRLVVGIIVSVCAIAGVIVALASLYIALTVKTDVDCMKNPDYNFDLFNQSCTPAPPIKPSSQDEAPADGGSARPAEREETGSDGDQPEDKS